MAANSNYRLGIISPEGQNNYLSSGDTLTIQPFGIEHSLLCGRRGALTKKIVLRPFCLIDNPSVWCNSKLYYSKLGPSTVNITFESALPPAHEYEISLYYVNETSKLVYLYALKAKNVQKNSTFVVPCSDAFRQLLQDSCLYSCNYALHFTFCIKISRKDILVNFSKKPDLILPATDCSILFENSAMTNCTIIVEGREFLVHKEILAAKSSVFLTMFESEMKEKKKNKVLIDDIEAEIFHEFLRYIYTNVINNFNLHADKLLAVAEKYDVSKLKLICSEEMCWSLTVENVVHKLKLADRYSLKDIKDRVLAFIKNNIKAILHTEEYKTLCTSEQSYLLNEIMQMFV